MQLLDLRNLQISLDCAAQSSDTRKSADCAPICRLCRSSKCAQQTRWSFDENRLHQFFGPDFQDNNWHFNKSKFKLSVQHQKTPECSLPYLISQSNQKMYNKNVHRVDRTSTSSNTRNFWAVLEMMAKRDDTLRKHIETGRKNAQYTSRIIPNEVIDVVIEYIRKEHTPSLEDENAFFSIMANEVTGPHGNQILSVYLRMLTHSKVKQFFFILYTLRGQRGKL